MDNSYNNIRLGGVGTQKFSMSVLPGRRRTGASQVVIQRNPLTKENKLVIGTWNVRTMLQAGKLENLKREMVRKKLDVVGLCEVRYEGCGELISGEVKMIFSGKVKGQNGVAIVLGKRVKNCVKSIELVSDRLMMVRLRAEPKDVVFIQVYMPTSAHTDEEVEDLYSQIEEMIRREEKDSWIILMGDMNAVVGEGKEDKIVGNFGYGVRNDRGDMLVNFCRENKLIITNTWFKNHLRRRYTWKAPGDRARYQIDYVMVQERFRNSIKKACAHPGADIGSDHNLVIVEMELRLKKVKRALVRKRWDLEKLKIVTEDFGNIIEKKLEKVSGSGDKDADEKWIRLKSAIVESAKEVVGFKENVKARKPWVSEKMIEKMDERRKWKSVNNEMGRLKYRKLNNELRRETEKARQQWLESECEAIEDLEKRGRYDLMYRKVKEIVWLKRKGGSVRCTESRDGKRLIKDVDIINRWEEYVRELYPNEGCLREGTIEDVRNVESEWIGFSILESEIEMSLKEMKCKKAEGVDGIPIEFFKSMKDEGKKALVDVCREIYETGLWPKEFLETLLIPIEKKAGASKCEDFRTISLISHAAKVLLRVVSRRLQGRLDMYLGEEQFGFRKGRGTRDAIGLMRVIGERLTERCKSFVICFVDLEKAFDRVNWDKLLEILKNKGIEWKERRLIRNLYKEQRVIVRIGNKESKKTELGRGVRQGCCLSPILFNIYLEEMIREIEMKMKGVKIGGRTVSCVRFADDMAVLAEDQEDLEISIKRLEEACKAYGMKVNAKKTKAMSVGSEEDIVLHIDGVRVEQVSSFKYLGSLLTEDWRCEKDVRARIGIAKEAFTRMKRVLCGSLDLELRKRLAKCFVWSVLLYGAETWTLREHEKKKLEAFEMWMWRRMLKISWKDKVSNVKVLERIGEVRTLLERIRIRKRNWIGHVLRGDNLLKDMIEGTVDGERKRGRKRMKMLDDLTQKNGYVYLKRLASDRKEWRKL
jgi:exonuclease III